MKLKKFFSTLTAASVALGVFAYTGLLMPEVSAAGVSITATPNEIALSTATDVTFTYTASNAVEAIGTTYTFVSNPTLPGALSNCTSADGFADANGTDGAGSFSGFSTTGATFTLTTATTTTGRSFCIKLPSIASAASYSFSIISSTGDFGAALVHVGDNNDVTVTAVVGPTLSFNIRNAADSADTNVCDLGSVDTTTVVDLDSTDDGVGECQYALATATNSDSGFQVTIDTDGPLDSGANTMTYVDDNGTFGTGTEEYGLANVTAPAGITEDSTASFTFQTDASPLSATPVNFISSTNPFVYTAGTDATDVTIVTHGLTVGTGTETGAYAQLVSLQMTSGF
jgi:hypothetical protein